MVRVRRLWWNGGVLLIVIGAVAWPLWADRQFHYAVHTLRANPQVLALARAAGFDTVVQLFSWREIEPTRGEFHWQYPDEVVRGAAYYGLDLVVRLDHHPAWASDAPLTLNAPPDDLEDYARFVRAVASRYRGRVRAYIIWNEPNLAREWGGRPPNPAEYVALLRVAHRAVKEADPEALVVSAGLAPTNHRDAEAMDDRLYLEGMYRAGARPFFDVLGAHPYGFGHPPDDPPGAHDGLNMWRVQDLRVVMERYGDGDKPVWATEMGWTVATGGEAAWQAVTPEQQAAYLVAAFTRARREWPWLTLMAVWNLDGGEHPEWGGYSLLDRDGTPRPAYEALRALDKGWDIPSPRELLTRAWEWVIDRWGHPQYPVLAEDVVVHLGDSQFPLPWVPLYGARNPSTVWRGTVYVRDPGRRPWQLTMRVMQSNVWGNYVWVNGVRLEPPMPREDFSGSWVSYTWEVPAGVLRPGPNEVTITINRTLPVLQDARFAWDDVQVKDIVLRR